DAGAIAGHGRGLTAQGAAEPTHVRLHEVAATRDRELDEASERTFGRAVLGTRHRRHRMEEPTLVAGRGREVHREPTVGAVEPAVHVPVRHGPVAPLVDVDERLDEHRVCESHRAVHVRYAELRACTRLSIVSRDSVRSRMGRMSVTTISPSANRATAARITC